MRISHPHHSPGLGIARSLKPNEKDPVGPVPRHAAAGDAGQTREFHGIPDDWMCMMLGDRGVSENVVYPIVPNGFADHYPY